MTSPNRPPGLIQSYREELQVRHHASPTISTDGQWVRRFLRFHHRPHPRAIGDAELNTFLDHLATQERVSASTQKQALAALFFLHRTVVGKDVGNLEGVIRARRRKKLLVVLTATKVRAVLGQQGSAHCAANQPGGAFETAHGKRETSSPV